MCSCSSVECGNFCQSLNTLLVVYVALWGQYSTVSMAGVLIEQVKRGFQCCLTPHRHTSAHINREGNAFRSNLIA